MDCPDGLTLAECFRAAGSTSQAGPLVIFLILLVGALFARGR